jgi:hypothetical protein
LDRTEPQMLYLTYPQPYGSELSVDVKCDFLSALRGQMVNTAVFYIFGRWRMIPNRVLTKSIVVASLTNVTVELLLLPVTLKVSLWLKRIENVDYFDKGTNFNW